MKEEYIKKETTSFKELVKNEQIFAPCVWDCRTARAAELTGFKALMLSGGQLATSLKGSIIVRRKEDNCGGSDGSFIRVKREF